MEYLNYELSKFNFASDIEISKKYEMGYLFTRLEKNTMVKTRSVRIDLNKFELDSENRRILRKGADIVITTHQIPFEGYKWEIGKLAKDFYDKKANKSFSANKIKEILTTNHNFNFLIKYSDLGFAICFKNPDIIHYSYPFYNLEKSQKDMGMIMILKAITESKTLGLNYFYLGSLQRPNDIYKLQLSGIEWFDGTKWRIDVDEVKELLRSIKTDDK